jgi:magnesium chelatase subunit I
VTNRAAKALAAFEGRSEVTAQDIFQVIPLCLRHRQRPIRDNWFRRKVQDMFKKVKDLQSKVVVIFVRVKIDFYK